MAGIFARLLGMSLTAGYLILAVIIARLLLKKAPRKTICVLWGLVGIRLSLPFSLESAFSLVPVRQIASLVPNIQLLSQDLLQASASQGNVGAASQGNIGAATLNALTESPLAGAWTQAPAASASATPAVFQVAAMVWLAGMAIFLAYSLAAYLKLRRSVASSVKLETNIFQCDVIDSPFVLGLFQPKIYLPFSLDKSYLDHVIAHETAHIKRHDHWIKPLGFLLLTVYWFNPLVWLAYILLCRDIELACDQKVLEQIGPRQRKAYSTSLLACSIKHSSIALCPVAFGEVGVRQRVKNMLNYRKPAFWLTLVAAAACVAIAVGFLTDPISRNAVVVTDQIDKAVSTAILKYNVGKYAAGECSGEGHQILLAAGNNALAGQDTLKIYAICSFSTFEFLNDNLVASGGNARIPTVMTFKLGPDGSYILQDYQEARDGSEMAPSIRRMFPENIQDAVLNVPEETALALNKQVEAYAADYLQKARQSAKVGDSTAVDGSHENKIITLASVLSPTVAKDLMTQYQAYPDFLSSQSMIGVWENDENGNRYVYEVIWEGDGQNRGKITFRKMIWDSEKVVSNDAYHVDGDQYQLVEQTRQPLVAFSAVEVDQAKTVIRAYFTALAAEDREALRQTLFESNNRLLDAPFDVGQDAPWRIIRMGY